MVDRPRKLPPRPPPNDRMRDDEKRATVAGDLIDRIVFHYKQYFEAKTRVVQENVFLVLTPTWFSSSSLGGLTKLMVEIKEEEKEVLRGVQRVQEGMVSPSMVELTRHLGRPRNGAEHNMESAVDRLSVSMEALVECADLLRRKTGILLVEILKPAQAVRFLQLRSFTALNLRRWGMQRDVQNRRHIAGPANVNGAQSPL
ncbi:hypothetical protein DH2020_044227 [Rehmannia glutinosa]|uniref:DOG1 domain-containing protein n=1 Tax=Rehmannia glutinosa TaxID=99300 RepID=A0ABR0UHI9_REHGL